MMYGSSAAPTRSKRREPRFVFALALVVFMIAQVSPAAAGPWTKDLGGFYLKLN